MCYFKFITLHITKMNELINELAVGAEARFICCLLVLMGFSLVSETFHSAVSHSFGYLLIATDSMCWYLD